MNLTEETITFGKYKDLSLSDVLKDRKYCMWLLKQEWFPRQYEYLYNRVKQHSPLSNFLNNNLLNNTLSNNTNTINTDFISNYKYFNLLPLSELKIELTNTEKICYNFYLNTIEKLKQKIINNTSDNCYDIKAPSKWLVNFEKETGLSRAVFKEFLSANELPNITSIVEDIKKQGGIEYKGAKSFLIAKKNSELQEQFWEAILKKYYGDEIAYQFKYKNCIFDFIRISNQTLFECKLTLRDFNEEQYNKYMMTLNASCNNTSNNIFSLVYLIDKDCIIDLKKQKIYTIDYDKYSLYINNIPISKKTSKFDKLIENFEIIKIDDIEDYFK